MDSLPNLLADLAAARRNAELQDARRTDTSVDFQVRHHADMRCELWLCEVQYLEEYIRVHFNGGRGNQNTPEQKGSSHIGDKGV